MAKLTGIRDSKGRFETFTKNNERHAPPRHQPVELSDDGSMGCSVCTGRYSPAAFAKHLTGAPMLDSDHGVYTSGMHDSWKARPDVAQQEQVSADPEAEWRARLIEAYYDQRDRPKNRIAQGVRKHAFFD